MRLSVCLIVRDEAPRLAAALDSLEGVADEVCVLDTGSSDDTVELALARGARVACTPWNDDFSAARNACMQLAGGDWILSLDADERLTGDPREVRDALAAFASQHPDSVGRVRIDNVEAGEVGGRVRVSRLLPRDGQHRFAGRVHEQIVRDVDGRSVEPRRRDVNVTLRHIGYDCDPSERAAKLSRNAALLERELERAPRDGYLWFQLGRTRARAEDPAGALSALERALEHCGDDAPWGICALEEGAYALRGLGASQQALSLLEQVEDLWRQRPDTCFLIALLAMDTGDLPRAERGFRHCLSLTAVPADAAESSPAAATYAPAFNLGVMCEVLGRRDEALSHYRAALALHPAHDPSREALRRMLASPVA